MPIADIQQLDELCASYGIAVTYDDIYGVTQTPDVATKCALLDALGCRIRTDTDISNQLTSNRQEAWQGPLPSVYTLRRSEPDFQIPIVLATDKNLPEVRWRLEEENGKVHSGTWVLNAIDAVSQQSANDSTVMRFTVSLPKTLPLGYHNLTVDINGSRSPACDIIVTPDTCYQPPALAQGRKLWGVSLQVYALRSSRNWGIGDFTDLQNAIRQLAAQGADFIAINPLHTLFNHQPENASPYSPSSRRFLNPIYIDVDGLLEEFGSTDIKEHIAEPKFKKTLVELRACELVDYTAVSNTKLPILRALYNDSKKQSRLGTNEFTRQFQSFREQGGRALFELALFEALQSHFHEIDNTCQCWQQWPIDFHDPSSTSVRSWAQEHADDIEFFQFIQWSATTQLTTTDQLCRSLGMSIGLIRDLAIGVGEAAQELWSEQSLYADGVSIGAPPDDFNANGQNWNLPPVKPPALTAQRYQSARNLLRENMRGAGALRIDHIMGLIRLYWIPKSNVNNQGSYVTYPLNDLLSILALESERNQCVIIGEDLGIVPDNFRDTLAKNVVLSFRVLFFEKDHTGTRFKSPSNYPHRALGTVGTHDTATLSGYWCGRDIDLKLKLGLLAVDDQLNKLRQARKEERAQLVSALSQERLMGDSEINDIEQSPMLTLDLAIAVQRYIARSNAQLTSVQIEDLFLVDKQVNMPGTVNEYPNWRIKLTSPVETWTSDSGLTQICQAIDKERKRPSSLIDI